MARIPPHKTVNKSGVTIGWSSYKPAGKKGTFRKPKPTSAMNPFAKKKKSK